ncbi:MAG: hypothetical protein ABTQ31_18025 [Rhizobiaceae bacterium]
MIRTLIVVLTALLFASHAALAANAPGVSAGESQCARQHVDVPAHIQPDDGDNDTGSAPSAEHSKPCAQDSCKLLSAVFGVRGVSPASLPSGRSSIFVASAAPGVVVPPPQR